MWIVNKSDRAIGEVCWWLQDAVAKSRFTAQIELGSFQSWNRYVCGIKISNIRLRERKDYCGQHPGPCQVNPFFTKKHLRGKWLEGLDWCSFNDGINDLLDAHNISADVFSYNREAARESPKTARLTSGRFYIRKGLERRISYDMLVRSSFGRDLVAWNIDGEFANCCGQGPQRSDYPSGTPGTLGWTEQEASLMVMEESHA